MTTGHDEEIARLRAEGLTAKSIAKRLGLSPAAVTAVVQRLAAAAPAQEAAFVGAWVSAHWTEGLGFAEKVAHWRRFDVANHEHPGAGGLIQVLVARAGRYDDVLVAGFLCDVWCLGVKEAFGPRTMKRQELEDFGTRFFSGHEGGGPLPLDVAQAIVLGAEAYGRSLGFEPPVDSAKARTLLGVDTAPAGIAFGRDGRPTFRPGLHDDVEAVRAKLRAAVGEGAFTVEGAPRE